MASLAPILEKQPKRDSRYRVELKVEADSTVANNLATQIQEMPGVKEVQINNPDDVMVELADYLNMNSDDIVNSIGYNPLQWELVVIPENPEDISSLAEEISKFTVVDKVIFEEEVIDKFTNLFVIFQWIAAGLAVLAIMVTMVVIGSIIALSVASRKEEIEVMSLVGAPLPQLLGLTSSKVSSTVSSAEGWQRQRYGLDGGSFKTCLLECCRGLI